MAATSVSLKDIIKKQTLNPALFTEKETLVPEVRKKLLQIANNFRDDLEIDRKDLKDIVLKGSNVNYNWSKQSDIDLHLLIDYKKITDNLDLALDYFTVKKNLYNRKHNITVKGIEVELYAEDIRSVTKSEGEYSLLKNEWISKPTLKEEKIDKEAIAKTYNEFLTKIKEAIKNKDIDKMKSLMDTLKQRRKKGIAKGGEFNSDNIVFKLLRHKGYLDKLSNKIIELTDKELTLEGKNY
jgi:hypothetical protein